jgi:thiol-disulfide isomerase/thioredoxin
VFEGNREIGKTLLYEYERVNIDIGKMDKNMDLLKKYGARADKEGVPYLTVLDADGKAIANQETGALEEGDHHDPAKVQAFLQKWTPKPENAKSLLDEALALAAKSDKKVFLSFGAPWCGYCHKLDDFLARDEVAAAMGKDFVNLKIDVDRMDDAEEIVKRFQASERGGLPWFVMVDAEGNSLGTSFGPKGNVGYPVESFEIAHFVQMLTKTKKRLTDDDIRKMETTLTGIAKELKRG